MPLKGPWLLSHKYSLDCKALKANPLTVNSQDLWLAKDNRFLNPKISYERILMAPPCRLISFLSSVMWAHEEPHQKERVSPWRPSGNPFINTSSFSLHWPIKGHHNEERKYTGSVWRSQDSSVHNRLKRAPAGAYGRIHIHFPFIKKKRKKVMKENV